MNEYIAWVKTALSRWKDFAGRSRRREYWTFSIASALACLVLNGVDKVVFGQEVLSGVLGLILLVPSLALSFRRLHDTGKSAWWLLLWIIPILGWVVLFIFTLQDSQPGTNRYGANPKGIA